MLMTICWGFLSHLSDNKHSLGSRRSGERPLDGSQCSLLEEGADGAIATGHHNDSPQANWLAWVDPARDRPGSWVGLWEPLARSPALLGMPIPGNGSGSSKYGEVTKDIHPPQLTFITNHRRDGEGTAYAHGGQARARRDRPDDAGDRGWTSVLPAVRVHNHTCTQKCTVTPSHSLRPPGLPAQFSKGSL